MTNENDDPQTGEPCDIEMSDGEEPTGVCALDYYEKADVRSRDFLIADKRDMQFRVIIDEDKTISIYSDANRDEMVNGRFSLLVARFTDYVGLWDDTEDDVYCLVIRLTDWLYVYVSTDIVPFQTYIADEEEITAVYYYDPGVYASRHVRALAKTANHVIVLPEMWRVMADPDDTRDAAEIVLTVERVCATDEDLLTYVFDDQAARGVEYDCALHMTWDEPPTMRHSFPWTETDLVAHSNQGVRYAPANRRE